MVKASSSQTETICLFYPSNHPYCNIGFVCHLLQEPLGGAHADPFWASQQIKHAIVEAMAVIPNVFGKLPKLMLLLKKE